MDIQEDRYSGGVDVGRLQKICEIMEMAFWGNRDDVDTS